MSEKAGKLNISTECTNGLRTILFNIRQAGDLFRNQTKINEEIHSLLTIGCITFLATQHTAPIEYVLQTCFNCIFVSILIKKELLCGFYCIAQIKMLILAIHMTKIW